MYNTCVVMGFTVKINLFKQKRFKDGRCRYKNTGSSHLTMKCEIVWPFFLPYKVE